MAKYIDLISDNTAKHETLDIANNQVVSDQAKLSADQQAAATAVQAVADSDTTLTAAVALQPQGVRDPSTGIVYQVISGVLHATKPADATELDVPTAPPSTPIATPHASPHVKAPPLIQFQG